MVKRSYNPAIVSSRLKTLRKEKGLTQIAVSSLTGISLPAIKQYETGARIPDSRNIGILARFYHVYEGFILGDTDSRNWVEAWKQKEPEYASRLEQTIHEESLFWNYAESIGIDYSELDEDKAERFIKKVTAFMKKEFLKLKEKEGKQK